MLDLCLLTLTVLWDFSLDGQRSTITNLLERRQIGPHIYLPFAQWYLGTPGFSWLLAPCCIFAVNTPDERTKLLERRDWFPHSVENHVGGIEIDEKILPLHIGDELHQRIG